MNHDPMQPKDEWQFPSWAGRGLSEWTVKALLANGVEEPERLLFMSEAQIKVIPGSQDSLGATEEDPDSCAVTCRV